MYTFHTPRHLVAYALLAGASAIPLVASAEELFTLEVKVGTETGQATFTSVPDLFDKFNNGDFDTIVNTYNDNAAATLNIGYRGLPIQVITTAGNSDIRLVIDSIGLDLPFTGTSREDSLNKLTNFFERDGGEIISALQKKLAETSPVDPIAGNPSSMQSQMAAGNYDQAFTAHATNIKSQPDAKTQVLAGNDESGLLALGLRFGRYSQGGLTTETVSLPFSYTYRGLSEGRQISIHMPLMFGTVKKAKIAQGGLGLAYRHPINEQWALTPAVNIAMAGSVDLGSVGAMTSTSLTSQYSMNVGSWDVSIGNMVGLYSTLKIKTKDFSYDPGIKNTILRNGIMASQPITVGAHQLAVEYSFINTQFSGTALYNRWTNEIGITIGTSRTSNLPSYLRAGLTLMQGQRSKGASFNFGYWF